MSTAAQRASDPQRPIRSKWKRCARLSRSLSTKPFPQWQELQTNRLEDWKRNTLENEDRSQELVRLLREDHEALQVYNELFDVLGRHLKALSRCPSVHAPVGNAKYVEEHERTPRVRFGKGASSRRSRSTAPSSVHGSRKTRLSKAASDAGVARTLRTPSMYSGTSGVSEATSEFSAHEMDVDSIAESKTIVDEAMQKLIDFTDSLPLGNNGRALPETTYRDFFYREIHRTVSKLMPKAKPFMQHRISRAGSARLRELAKSKEELKSTLAQTYYAGKYTKDATDQWMRRIASLPNDVIEYPSLDCIEHPLRRSYTGEERIRSPSKRDQLRLEALKGIGDQYPTNSENVHAQEGSDADSSLFDSEEAKRRAGGKESSANPRNAIYICFEESCPSQYTHYDSREAWETHIRETHLVLTTGTWACKAWCHNSEPGGYPSFHREDEFREHMMQQHPATFQDLEYLKDLADACYRPPPANAAQVNCTLCTEEWERDLQLHGKWDADALLAHVAGHLEEIGGQIMFLPACDTAAVRHETPTYEGSVIETNAWVKHTIGEIQKLK